MSNLSHSSEMIINDGEGAKKLIRSFQRCDQCDNANYVKKKC